MSKPRLGLSGDMRNVIKQVEAMGCRVTATKGDHLRILLPNGRIVHAARTASDYRTPKNTLADVRRLMKE